MKTCAESSEPVSADVFTDESHTFDLVAYHIEMMRDAGLIRASITREAGESIVSACVESPTWEGNDFLDAVKSDSIWTKTKQRIATTVGAASFDVVKAVAVRLASSMLGL